jgi:Zn-dependent protease
MDLERLALYIAHLAIFYVPGVFVALTVHEYAHGYVAWRRGDDTAKKAGRLTLNPLSHLDPFGLLMLLWGPFGWAKPVPVDPRKLGNPRRDMLYVSAAGPLANIALALLFGGILRFVSLAGTSIGPGPASQNLYVSYVVALLKFSFRINIGLSFFNLLPVPPLDGSKILMSLLPPTRLMSYLSIVQHAPKVFLALILIEWAFPNVAAFSMVITPVWKPYFTFWQWLVFGGKVM